MALVVLLTAASASAACSVTSVSALAFGTYDPFTSVPRDSSGSVTITCSGLIGLVTVDLSAGQSTVMTARTMNNGANLLSYAVYFDALRTFIMGNGVAGTSHYGPAVAALGIPITFQFYGRIPARQAVAPGTYGDTLVITVSF